MGRWMEMRNRRGEVISEMAPNLLIHASSHLPRPAKSEFPVLTDLDLHSSKWNGELQILNFETAEKLNLELKKISDLLNMKGFIKGVDNRKILKYWTDDDYSIDDLNDDINALKIFIEKALDNKFEIRIYL